MSITFPYPFGKYVLLNRIAVGGMAEIFRAKTIGAEGFEKEIVIKRILSSYSADEAFVKMFIDEAKIAAELHHANIIQIFDFDKYEDCYYIAMEYVEGKDLRKIIDQGVRINMPLSPIQVVHIIIEISRGLDYAHTKKGKQNQPLNIIHRDISPHNILISYNGEVKLTDFGIAKAAARATKTVVGTVKGKCSYMSPEQARGKEIDQRSDIFSLGAVMWEALTQKKLFDGETDYEILTKVLNANVIPPSKRVKGVSKELDRIILKALERDREKRYQTANAFLRDLQNFFINNVTNIEESAIDRYMQTIFFEEIRTLRELGITGEQKAKEENLKQAASAPQKKAQPLVSEEKAMETAAPKDKSQEPPPIPIDHQAMTTLLPSSALETQESFELKDSVPDAVTILLNRDELQENKTVLLSAEIKSALEIGEKKKSLSSPSQEVYKAPVPSSTLTPGAHTKSKPVIVRTDHKLRARGETTDLKLTKPAVARNLWLFASLILAAVLLGGVVLYVTSSTEISPVNHESHVSDAFVVRDSGLTQTIEAASSPMVEEVSAVVEAISAEEIKLHGDEVKLASLIINVNPKKAAVKVNGEPVKGDSGRLVIKSKFRVGETVNISASHRGYSDYSTYYTVVNGENFVGITLTPVKRYVVKAETGYVFINAKPWADVYFKGRKIGTTPIRKFKVPVGLQKFTLKNQAATKVIELTVERDKQNSIVVDMQK